MRKPKSPIPLEELMSRRGHDIFESMTNPDYAEFARRAAASYWHWDRLQYIGRAARLDPETAWATVKMGRMQQYKMLPLLGKNSVTLRYTIPDFAQQELMRIDQELAGRFLSDIEQPLSHGQRERFVISALQDEAIASSMLEGAVTTRADAKNMLRSGRSPRSRGERMVLNNYKTILFVREHRNVDLSTDFLLEVQRILTEETLDDPGHVGRLRTSDDDIKIVDERDNEIMHIPPPAEELPYRLRTFCDFANAPGDQFVHPVIKACILHFQLGFDHPFCDGNGRTARAIFYWHLLRAGYWLFEFLPISPMFHDSPAKYARAYLYTETDDFDVTYFLLYNLKIIARGRRGLREYLRRKQAQLVQANRLFRSDPALNHRQREVLLRLARNPDVWTTIAHHQGVQNVAYGTARSDLFDLVERGYLIREKVRKQYVFFAGPRLLELESSALEQT